jgi:hypothetical protein
MTTVVKEIGKCTVCGKHKHPAEMENPLAQKFGICDQCFMHRQRDWENRNPDAERENLKEKAVMAVSSPEEGETCNCNHGDHSNANGDLHSMYNQEGGRANWQGQGLPQPKDTCQCDEQPVEHDKVPNADARLGEPKKDKKKGRTARNRKRREKKEAKITEGMSMFDKKLKALEDIIKKRKVRPKGRKRHQNWRKTLSPQQKLETSLSTDNAATAANREVAAKLGFIKPSGETKIIPKKLAPDWNKKKKPRRRTNTTGASSQKEVDEATADADKKIEDNKKEKSFSFKSILEDIIKKKKGKTSGQKEKEKLEANLSDDVKENMERVDNLQGNVDSMGRDKRTQAPAPKTHTGSAQRRKLQRELNTPKKTKKKKKVKPKKQSKFQILDFIKHCNHIITKVTGDAEANPEMSAQEWLDNYKKKKKQRQLMYQTASIKEKQAKRLLDDDFLQKIPDQTDKILADLKRKKKKPKTKAKLGREGKKRDDIIATQMNENRAVATGKVRPPTPKHWVKPTDKAEDYECPYCGKTEYFLKGKDDVCPHCGKKRKGRKRKLFWNFITQPPDIYPSEIDGIEEDREEELKSEELYNYIIEGGKIIPLPKKRLKKRKPKRIRLHEESSAYHEKAEENQFGGAWQRGLGDGSGTGAIQGSGETHLITPDTQKKLNELMRGIRYMPRSVARKKP